MTLRPLRTREDFELAASWLQQKENHQWLDFGDGRRRLTPALLRIMAQRDNNFIRLYAMPGGERAIGIVALGNVDRHMRTGTLWAVAGDETRRNRGYAQLACKQLLALAFRELGLHSVNTWTVEHNASVRSALRLGFRFIGRQRQCHFIDDEPYDRLLFDLLACEHLELGHRPGRGIAVAAERALAAGSERWGL